MFETAQTRNILVQAFPQYRPDESDPQAGRFIFSYRIRIENQSQQGVQLLSRHWIITDGVGRVEEVRGEGVIGQQPSLAPGEAFEYESFCPLPTPTGVMRGTYTMISETGEKFEVNIPQFFLVEPNSFH